MADQTGQRGFSRLTSFATLSSQPLEHRLPDPTVTISFSMMALRSTSGSGLKIASGEVRGSPWRHLEGTEVGDALGGEHGDLSVDVGGTGFQRGQYGGDGAETSGPV